MSDEAPIVYTEKQMRIGIMQLLQLKMKRQAAEILWPWIVQNEQSERIWKALDESSHLAIMGHGSASKTFTCAQWFLLDWWSSPDETAFLITSDTLASMQRRVWSDLKMLWKKTCVPMPGILVDSKRIIQFNALDQKNAVAAIAADSDDATSKIQGLHTKRVRVLIDEADNKLSRSIWLAIPNLETAGDFKVCALANPLDRQGDFARHCEPAAGWGSLNPESDHAWKGKLGWDVLRLDGLRSPNITAGRDDFPFLLTNKGLESIREKNGEHSPQWWSYVRAFYPPAGSIHNIFSPDIIQAATRQILWYSNTTPCAACDPAFEGGDACVLALGRYGRLATNPRNLAVQVEQFIRIQRVNTAIPITIDFAQQIIAHCKAHGVKPENLALDCTGNALGLSDYIRHSWGPDTLPVSFGGAPTDMRITLEDSKKASERFDRFVSELWYVAREWCKLGLCCLTNPPPELGEQLESRLYRLVTNQKIRVETKGEMKERGLQSPDFGDAFCLMVHLVRTRSQGFVPGIFEPAHRGPPLQKFKRMEYVSKADYGVEG